MRKSTRGQSRLDKVEVQLTWTFVKRESNIRLLAMAELVADLLSD